MGVISFIIILGVLVLVHEAGHFFAARRAGVAVEEFGLGFPPRLLSWRRGPTLFSLNLIPFGGFVRLLGEQGSDADRPDSFTRASTGRQLIILVAGVAMNVVFAWVAMAVVLGMGVAVDPASVPDDRHVIRQAARTDVVVLPGSAAAQVGLQTGDVVEDINGQQFKDTASLIQYITDQQYPTLAVRVQRDGASQVFEVRPQSSDQGQRYGIGISSQVTVRYPWVWTPWYGLTATGSLAREAVRGFGQLAQGLAQGRVSDDVTGPIGIAVITSQVSRLGIMALIQFSAILSISLAILNILPLPALDGGRISLRLFSLASRRPVNRQLEGAIHAVGFYLLVAFLLYISVRDVGRFDVINRLTAFFQ